MPRSSNEIRQAFLDYFAEQGHAVVASSSLIPAGDPTLLFTNAGMVQFKDTFLGLEKRPYTRATSSQKVMRVSGKHNDFENVGPSLRHHTFFEMLGNFSFGDYFKKEAILFAWDLLVHRFGLDPQRMWFTVFEGDAQVPADDEAERLWYEAGARPGRVLRFGRKDNFWQMGDTGPCGPNSEIHYYRGPHPEDPGFNRAEYVNGDGVEMVEMWNLVFMQYDMRADGALNPLPKPSVDTGASLERVAAVLQGKTSNYDTDLFTPIIRRTEELLGRSPADYDYPARSASYRVIADHSRAIAFLIADGVNPSNEGRGYVTRLILRRAARHGQLLGFTEPFLDQVIPTVIELMGAAYPELVRRRGHILRITREEEEKFRQTLRVGSELLDDIVAELKARGDTVIPGEEAFRLYDTYGFPLDLTREVARENQLTVDERGFRAAMEEAAERSRAASGGEKRDNSETHAAHTALDQLRALGQLPERGVMYDPYAGTAVATRLAGILRGDELLDSLRAGEHAQLVLPETCFYVESGGQISDIGRIVHQRDDDPSSSSGGLPSTGNHAGLPQWAAESARAGDDAASEANGSGAWEFRVDDTRMPVPGLIVHVGQMVNGVAHLKDQVLAQVDAERRLDIMRNHTATHLLHAELRAVLGEHVQQAGSLVAPDRLRFDFTHTRPVSSAELERIEAGVNQAILQDYPVQPYVMPYKDAIGKGAMALFTEKYGDVVRMMEIDGVSRELCGGTHVHNTGEIGLFHIVAESSIGSGVRRIEAVTGPHAYEEFHKGMRTLETIGAQLRATPDEVATKVSALLAQLDAQQKEIARLHRELARRQAQNVEQVVRNVGGVSVVAQRVDAPSIELLREQIDFFRNKIGSGVIAVGAVINDKPNLVVGVTPDLVEKGFDARKIVGAAAKVMGGGGGGKPTLATAGGREADKLQAALDFVCKLVEEQGSK
jgi:alanyl-tRNA synthetase